MIFWCDNLNKQSPHISQISHPTQQNLENRQHWFSYKHKLEMVQTSKNTLHSHEDHILSFKPHSYFPKNRVYIWNSHVNRYLIPPYTHNSPQTIRYTKLEQDKPHWSLWASRPIPFMPLQTLLYPIFCSPTLLCSENFGDRCTDLLGYKFGHSSH